MRRIAAIMGLIGVLLAGCVAQEYTVPTLAHLPTLTDPPPIAALPTDAPTITPEFIPSATRVIPTPPPGDVTSFPGSAPTPATVSLALANAAGTPFRPLNALAPVPFPTLPPLDQALIPTALVSAPTAIFTLPPFDPPTMTFATLPPLIAAAPTGFAAEAALLTSGPLPAPLTIEELGDAEAMRRFLRAVPTFSGFDGEAVRAIAARGRTLGARADVFTTVGDSNSVSGDFLRPLVLENYCQWGEYAALEEAVRFYSVPPDGIAESSFTRESITVQMGFNSASARDPFWATDPRCAGGETPFTCELRVTRPGTVIFMLGNKDSSRLTAEAYRANMEAMVDEAIAGGTIPVLTTFVVLPERGEVYGASLMFNVIQVEIARARGIPLINLWAAAERLPDHGIAADRTHLRTDPGDFCDFTGGERRYGGTLRNLLTLTALDLLRRVG